METGNPFRLIELLVKHRVPFVIIGGHAVTYHGYVRATEDTDIVFKRSSQSEKSLLAALQEVNASRISDEIDPQTGIERTVPVSAEYIRTHRLMMLVTNHGFLDVFDFVPGFPDQPVEDLFLTAVQRGEQRFVSLPWLRKLKAASGRAKDQVDLQNLPDVDSPR